MKAAFVSQKLWTELPPLAPDSKPSQRRPPRLDDRAAFNGILFVLQTGTPWGNCLRNSAMAAA